jgi:catechol 2,3-dioxygenase-like lactoylglutathione lyase family enzyme
MSGAVFTHANIVAGDPDRLAAFYVKVFGCTQSGPRRHLEGEGLERGMGLPGAVVDGVHLLLPGHGENGPTLEIFKLPDLDPTTDQGTSRPGLMHLAFAVENIEATLSELLAAGGQMLGEIAQARVEGVGSADFVYARDPDGNIIELQAWSG